MNKGRSIDPFTVSTETVFISHQQPKTTFRTWQGVEKEI